MLFKSIEILLGKHSNLKIITQGYDYAIPSSKTCFKIKLPIIKTIFPYGLWLETPLLSKGFNKKQELRVIVYGMIEHFNEMLIALTREYKNAYHADCRG